MIAQNTDDLHPIVAHEISAVIRRTDEIADGVRSIEFHTIDGEQFPAWTPGAHIDVVLRDGIERQYSLCGDPADRSTWTIAVQRERQGRGGSEFLFSTAAAGQTFQIRGPRNHFELKLAQQYLFVAGGIGITPLHPMVRAAAEAGADWRLVYAGQSRSRMPFAAELQADFKERVDIFAADEGARADVSALISKASPKTLIYCCGPMGLVDAVTEAAQLWPRKSLTIERFEAKAPDLTVVDTSFEVELALSGTVLTVPSDRTILEAIEEAGITVLSSCREGTCGTCETIIIDGEADHRDSVLTPDEQKDNEQLMICVSRSLSQRLTLEL